MQKHISGIVAMMATRNMFRHQVCEYAFDNRGIRHDTATGEIKETNPDYGTNTEWLAEAIADTRNNKDPNEYSIAARKALEEMMKEAGLK